MRRACTVIFLLFAVSGCARGYLSLGGRVLTASRDPRLRRPIRGAEVVLRLPTRIYSQKTGPDGKFYKKYTPSYMSISDFDEWVAIVTARGYGTAILRVGRRKGAGGIKKKFTFLLLRRGRGEPADLHALRKALWYLSEKSGHRKAFAINALGMLAHRNVKSRSREIGECMAAARRGVGEVLVNSDNVRLRRIAARKIGLLRPLAMEDVFLKALEDRDGETAYWTVRTLADLYGRKNWAYETISSAERDRGGLKSKWREFLSKRANAGATVH